MTNASTDHDSQIQSRGDAESLGLVRHKHSQSKGYTVGKLQWLKWDYLAARKGGRSVAESIWYAVREMFRPLPF